mgnify:CR=1 FL=1
MNQQLIQVINQLKSIRNPQQMANVESLKAVNADIANLKVDYEKVGILDASVADIKTLIFGSATGTTITTDFSNSVIAVLGEAQIKSAMLCKEESLRFLMLICFSYCYQLPRIGLIIQYSSQNQKPKQN